jgi:hypothetical protein
VVSSQSLRNWVRLDARDRGERDDGLASAEREELRDLRKRVKRLEQEREILKHGDSSGLAGAGLATCRYGNPVWDGRSRVVPR